MKRFGLFSTNSNHQSMPMVDNQSIVELSLHFAEATFPLLTKLNGITTQRTPNKTKRNGQLRTFQQWSRVNRD